jgi:phosphatidylserine decarboxylase
MNTYIHHAFDLIFVVVIFFGIGLLRKSKTLIIASFILLLCLFYFFRGWNNNVKHIDDTVLYCPCDGIVKDIVDRGNHIHVVIFLNIHNIHAQYAPFKCRVEKIQHKLGSFHPAYLLEKSIYNERVEYTLLNDVFGKVGFVQIAGQVARRIVSFLKEGVEIEGLSPIGLIKLGSRCDLHIPKQRGLELLTSINNRIRIGDPIAKISNYNK